MAKLTHEQRLQYERDCSLNVSMKDERKTFFDYKTLTPSIKQEFLDIMLFAFSDTAKKMSWDETKISSNQHFRYNSGNVQVATEFYGHRLEEARTRYSVTILRVGSQEIMTLSYAQNHKHYSKLRVLVHDYCENELGFEKRNDYSSRWNFSYYKFAVMSSELRAVLDVSINEIAIDTHVLPGKPHSLCLSRTEGLIEYNNRGRVVSMKIGKGLKKFFKIYGQNLSDEEVKSASNRLNLKISDFTLKVVCGSDIDEYYYEGKYDFGFDLGSLGSSCMRYSACVDNDYFEIYKDNATMLILVNEDTDLIIGRAILWDDVRVIGNSDDDLKDGSKIKVMDRIYSAESTYSVFKDWALENGYYRKRYQSYDNGVIFRSPISKEEVDLDLSLDICLNDYSYVPYMDTFAWGDNSITTNDDGYGCFSARSTEGELDGGDNQNYDEDWDEDDDED
tara:strand:+ start:2630 stop:3973 length:1344 start_codon:yes stop_codon:yes gene_type:complete